MIDTGRHFASISELKEILDAMSWTKLNIFHWHISDAMSFPFDSKTHKTMKQGAFSEKSIYSHEDIQNIIEYANNRGITVIPELDMPSHTSSWGAGHSELTIPYVYLTQYYFTF